MNRLIEKIPLSDTVLIFLEALLLLFLILLLARQISARKTKNQYVRISQQRQRNEELDRLLKNPVSSKNRTKNHQEPKPYEVSYKEQPDPKPLLRPGIKQIDLRIETDSSTKKFLLDLEDTLTIGRSPDNKLVLDSRSVSSRHCELIQSKGNVFLRDLGSSNGTILQRGNSRLRVRSNPVRIMSRDVIQAADVRMEVVILD